MPSKSLLAMLLLFLFPASTFATVFGSVRGIVHDPRHRPIQGAEVILSAESSEWAKQSQTNADGEFEFPGVPVGQYALKVRHQGFDDAEQRVTVLSGSAPILHFPMKLAQLTQSVEVTAAPSFVDTESSTAESVVDRRQIAMLPGADRTNSLAMITDLVPGASIVHDQLHIRGGHQVSWLVDGIPVVNTNIGGNVGPQFDPRDVDYLEVQRGGFSSEYGDRAYGVFNIVPRSGFERNSQAELTLGFGGYNETNDQFSVGSHTQRFAYYASMTGSRTDLGLQTPAPETVHDLSGSLGGFTSLIYNPTPLDQFRLVGSFRGDHYQVPNTLAGQAIGTRDIQDERDSFVNFSWVRTLGPGFLVTVSPLFHRNRAAFEGGPGDTPVIPEDDRTSIYAGGQIYVSLTSKKHNLRAGISGIDQRDSQEFSLRATDGVGPNLAQDEKSSGVLSAGFVEDQYKLTSWLTLNGGVRLTYFSGLVEETTASPRAGAALRVPRLNWVLRGFYGRYYQPPPLSTIAGPLLDVAAESGFGFLPLRGERDEQKELGLTIPIKGWAVDITHYHTNARTFFDHDALGNSGIFFPLTIAGARLRGWEFTAQSPQLLRGVHAHLAYSHAYAEGEGSVTGGLTDFSPPPEGLFFLDHDQRDTVAAGFEAELPRRVWVSGNLSYGSGFLDGDGPAHLQGHTTVDFSVGKSFGESLSLRLSVLNLANSRYLLDSSNSFGGTHYNYPREISFTLRYRFHY